MPVAVALVPDTALLVPGAAGGGAPLDDLRAAAVDAVREACAHASRVVVVAPGPADRELVGAVRATLAAAGVPDHLLGGVPPTVVAGGRGLGLPAPDERHRSRSAGIGGEVPVGRVVHGSPAAGTALALHLLAAAGWSGPVDLVEVARPRPDGDAGRAAALRAFGRTLARTGSTAHAGSGGPPGSTALVVVGSPSGRHGPDAPLADDDRAPAHDERLLADLAAPTAAARARLAADDEGLAHALAVTGWSPWQVLLGAVGDAPVRGRLVRAQVVAGAHHAVLVWSRT